jgi:hypothetical protein
VKLLIVQIANGKCVIRRSAARLLGIGLALAVTLVVFRASGQEKDTKPTEKKATSQTPEKVEPTKDPAAPADPKAGKAPAIPKKPPRPKKAVTRRELMEKPGAPREPIDKLFPRKALNVVAPSPQEQDAFDRMRRGAERPDPVVIERNARWHVHRLTEPNREARLSREIDEILRFAQGNKTSGGQPNTEFIRLYKRSLVKYLKDLLDNSRAVRVNALVLLRKLFDGAADPHEGVVLAISVLKDPKQPDFCYYLALKALEQAADYRILLVDDERETVDYLLPLAKGKDVQEVLLEQIAITFGRLGRAFQGNLPERAEVGTFLANLALNDTHNLRTRFEAAVALARLQVQKIVRNWNYELEAVVVARLMRELLQANRDAKISTDLTRWWTNQLAVVLATRLQEPIGDGYLSFLRVAEPIIQQVLNQGEPDLGPLDRWIAAHEPPKNLRLAPQAEEIAFPAPTSKKPEPPTTQAAGSSR